MECWVHLCLTAAVGDALVDLSAIDLSTAAVQQSAASRLLQLEAGTLLANTPVGVYRHQLRAVRERLRLEVTRSDQYYADAQLARDQLRAEIEARNSIQVTTKAGFLVYFCLLNAMHMHWTEYKIT